jgi:prophage regulatory protein
MLSQNDVIKITGLSRATLHRMRRAQKFPDAFKLSDGRVGWRTSVINQWLAERTTALRH